jgi:hypothetical protein
MNARRNVLGRRGPDSLGLGRDGRPSPDSARGVPRLRDAEELVHGYGFPPLTEQAKRKLLGENYCRLHGLDVETVKADVADDDWARQRRASTPRQPLATIRDGSGPKTEA